MRDPADHITPDLFDQRQRAPIVKRIRKRRVGVFASRPYLRQLATFKTWKEAQDYAKRVATA